MKRRLAILTAMTAIMASASYADTTCINLRDVTSQYIYKYDHVVSAFPELYDIIPTEENFDITKVFHFNAIKSPFGSGNPGAQGYDFSLRRIEVFVTGGDWMEYPIVYFVTDAEQVIPRGKPGCQDPKERGDCDLFEDHPRAYNIPQLSTPDREGGEVAPEVDVQNADSLFRFISERFLDENGMIRDGFVPLEKKHQN